MKLKPNKIPAKGWKGGFSTSNPKFSYPNPDLESIPMTSNMANLNRLKRQQNVRWPEFSWFTEFNQENSRCFQMFSPFISRLGYTDQGRIYSIICPQQGTWLGKEICLNVEVTVTGVKGWVNEADTNAKPSLAGEMQVKPKIWLSPKEHQSKLLKEAWDDLKFAYPNLPLSKEHAIELNTHRANDKDKARFTLRKGETDRFKSPEFSQHYTDSAFYEVANLEVQISDIIPTYDKEVDDFSRILMKAFNIGSGNMLAPTNILTWNVWFINPQLVDTKEWKEHAALWRKSIDAHHGPPYNKSEKDEWPHLMAQRPVRYFNGEHFSSKKAEIEHVIKEIYDWIENHLEP